MTEHTPPVLVLTCRDGSSAHVPLPMHGHVHAPGATGILGTLADLCPGTGCTVDASRHLDSAAQAWPLQVFVERGGDALLLRLRRAEVDAEAAAAACADAVRACYALASGHLHVPGYQRCVEAALCESIAVGAWSPRGVRRRYAGFDRVDVLCDVAGAASARRPPLMPSPTLADLRHAAQETHALFILYDDGARVWMVYNEMRCDAFHQFAADDDAFLADSLDGRGMRSGSCCGVQFDNPSWGRFVVLHAALAGGGGSDVLDPARARWGDVDYLLGVALAGCAWQQSGDDGWDTPHFPPLDAIQLVVGLSTSRELLQPPHGSGRGEVRGTPELHQNGTCRDPVCLYARNPMWRRLFRGV